MAVVCDYSAARPDLAALKAAGIDGIVRYCTRFGLTAQEVQTALGIGLTVTLVMEWGTQPALRGYPGGVADAQAANAAADQVGYDPQAWIFYVAEDPSRLPVQDYPTVDAYMAGVASVGGRPVGAYGGLQLVQHLLDTRLATRGWVVRPWGGVNGNVHLAQEVGGVPAQFKDQIDVDTVLQADYGQMPRPSAQQFSTGEEPAMFSYTLGPDGVRKDAVWVNPDSTVGHGWTATGDLAHLAVENLGGQAKGVCGHGWDKAGNYTVVVHGTDDRPYLRVSTAGRWINAWTPLAIQLHPPAAGPAGAAGPVGAAGAAGVPGKPGTPGPAGPATGTPYDDTALTTAVAALQTKVAQVAKDLGA